MNDLVICSTMQNNKNIYNTCDKCLHSRPHKFRSDPKDGLSDCYKTKICGPCVEINKKTVRKLLI